MNHRTITTPYDFRVPYLDNLSICGQLWIKREGWSGGIAWLNAIKFSNIGDSLSVVEYFIVQYGFNCIYTINSDLRKIRASCLSNRACACLSSLSKTTPTTSKSFQLTIKSINNKIFKLLLYVFCSLFSLEIVVKTLNRFGASNSKNR